MPPIAETQYGRIIYEEAGHPGIEVQPGEPTNVIERFQGKIQYYNQLLNVHLTVESNPQVQDIAISDDVIQVNPATTGAIRNEDFLLLHECIHDKQRVLLGAPDTVFLIYTLDQDLTRQDPTPTELGGRNWEEKYDMPPFIVSLEAQLIIFGYYSGQLRRNLARGIRDVHSDMIALRNRKNIYLTDKEREDGIDPEEKFYSQFHDELTANVPWYDYHKVQDTEPDFIRKIARFRAVAGGADQILENDYSVIAKDYDKYMRKTFGEESRQYEVYTALSQAYQTYFINCTKRADLIDPQQMIAALDSPNFEMRARTVGFLGEIRDVRMIKPLMNKFLSDKDFVLRWMIVAALLDIARVPQLKRLLFFYIDHVLPSLRMIFIPDKK